ncbi:phospholipid-transporting ATPase IF-like isoform X2 [Prorops nasuta]|uniref:phospholipid-transporting ATPase IF-like isoform X2 n=1 Tax=Prorops nasuta TaxID=863751 RepID=UPI0034CDE40C
MWNFVKQKLVHRASKETAEYFNLLGSTTSVYSEHRIIKVNTDNDVQHKFFPNNRVISSKYTIWNFIPKNLFEQFRRIANFYFLITALVAMLIKSPISPLTSSLPLLFVILVTACKQGYEDYLRHRVDQRVNKRLVTVIRNKCTQDIHCQEIVVGDLVKVNRDEDIPCDLVLLYSKEENGFCYVTTSNLDGETNLKTLHVPKLVSSMTLSEIVSIEATITGQNPLADLYTFHGKLEIENDSEISSGYLNIDNILLRGARLKDTEFIIGCAVFTGQDTKLSLNSKVTTNKFSTAEKSINKYLLLYICLLLIEVFVSTVLKVTIEANQAWDVYLGPSDDPGVPDLLTDILSFTILYNYIVPISLYVSIELQKFLGSFFFVWDLEMYDEVSNQTAISNTSDLNEELGQVEYLFTDKTGTLTENHMVFKRCSIDGYTYMEKDCDGFLYQLPPNGDDTEAVKLATWRSEIWHFMISISICHVVQIAPPSHRASIIARRSEYRKSFKLKKITKINSTLLMHPDLPEYQAASADEKALVEASARCGIVFKKSSSDRMEVKIKDSILTFEKLGILEFSSERKRMSVIVRDAANDIWLYCKGADTAVFPLVDEGKIEEAINHVRDFSMRGLRTLVVGFKKLKQPEFDILINKVEEARQIIGIDRAMYVERAYTEMESGLTLLGVTAVEDRLQEGVQETLESLRVAGIKVWVLTGDKAETAENIAFLCGHFKSGTEVLRLMDQNVSQTCFLTLTSFERKIKLEPYKQYGLIVDGISIKLTLKNYPELFKFIGMACESVVCCRLTPLQKSEIVHLVKTARSRPTTSAIGDGGNDVSMIQEAHVGIGIMGKEGRQATMCSDFAIAKFMYLKKVLLVHGHWYYIRISTLTQYFFYKNLVFITPQLLFGIHSGFSTQELYDGMFLMCFNVLFTSLPVMVFGLLEQDHSSSKLLKNPHLYKLYRKNYLLSNVEFVKWTITAIWQTCLIYFSSYYFIHLNPVQLSDSTPFDHWSYSTTIFHIVTLVTNLQILLHSSYWTLAFIASIILSEIVFLAFAFCYSLINVKYDGNVYWVFQKLLMSPTFWLLTGVLTVACLIPGFLVVICNTYRPEKVLRKNEELPIDPNNCNSCTNIIIDTTDQSLPQTRRFSNFISWRGSFSFHKTE